MQSKKCPQCNLTNFVSAERCKRCDLSFKQPTEYSSQERVLATSPWYYSKNGERIGPVKESVLSFLVKSGTLTSETLVWQSGVADWTYARQTDLAQLFASFRNEPPPLLGDAVDNNLAWTIALAPILSGILLTFLYVGINPSAEKVGKFLFFSLIFRISVNSVLCIADVLRLEKAGHNTKDMFLWALILTPAYLAVRASRLKQDYSYTIVWGICFVASIFIFRV